jgi:hypothetical protein
MKKVILFAMVLFVLLALPVYGTGSENNVILRVNGAVAKVPDAPAYVDPITGIIMVPLRFLSVGLGAGVRYTSNKKPIIITGKGIDGATHTVTITLNSKKAVFDGVSGTIDQAPVMRSGRIYIPLYALALRLGVHMSGMGTDDKMTIDFWTKWSYTKWTPIGNQKETAHAIFEGLAWDPSAKTISLNIPSFPGKTNDTTILIGQLRVMLEEGSFTSNELTSDELPDDFEVEVQVKDGTGRGFRFVSDHYGQHSQGVYVWRFASIGRRFVCRGRLWTHRAIDGGAEGAGLQLRGFA